MLCIPPLAEWKKMDTKHLFCCVLRTPNRRLLSRKTEFEFVRPYDLIPKYREKCERSPAEGGASEQSIASEFEKSLSWSQLLNEARTFFEQEMLD